MRDLKILHFEGSGNFVSYGSGDFAPHESDIFRFQGLAVRIEDDVLVTSSGPQILNEGTPQTIEDITSLINNS